MPDPIEFNARFLDLSDRVVRSTAVVASPATTAETIIASVTIPQGLTITTGVLLHGWAAWTVGTAGVSGQMQLRQTTVSGTVVANSGAVDDTAAKKVARSILGFDAAPADGQIYKLTLTVASASAGSTVSAVALVAVVI